MRRGWARLTGMRPADGAGAAGARSCCPSCTAEISKHPAGGGEGRGPREYGRVRRCLDSESPGLRSQALFPRPRLRGLYFSSPPPREITKTSPGPGPESLQQRWKPPSVHFDVGGWGLARPLWGASKGAAFLPVRASNLARTLSARRLCAADSHSPLARGTERNRPARGSRLPRPRARSYRARKDSVTAPAAWGLGAPTRLLPLWAARRPSSGNEKD